MIINKILYLFSILNHILIQIIFIDYLRGDNMNNKKRSLFKNLEALTSILLIFSTLLALIINNSSYEIFYDNFFFNTYIVEDFNVHSFVNDFLMSIFLKTFPFWTGKRTKSILPENSGDFVLSIINPCISLFIKIIKTARFFDNDSFNK